MKILAVISQKGGAGKSLLSVHLAVAFQESGVNTMVIDLDRQGSSTQWGRSRKIAPAVVAAQGDRLAVTLDDAHRSGVGLLIIDTPPHSDRNALSAASIADLTLIPIKPAIFDLRAVRETVELLQAAKRKDRGLIVLNAVPPQASVADDAEEASRGYGVEIAPMRIGDRAALSYALIGGKGITEFEPRGKAAKELRDLQSFIAQRLGFRRRA